MRAIGHRKQANLENGCGLKHLGHKRRDALQLAVACSDASKDAVYDADVGTLARNKAANLRHQHTDADLAKMTHDENGKKLMKRDKKLTDHKMTNLTDVGALATHVWSSDDLELGHILDQVHVVGDEIDAILHFDTRMTRCHQRDGPSACNVLVKR